MGSVSIANSLAFAPNFYKGMTAAAKINQLLEREPAIQDPKDHDQKSDWEAYGGVTYYNAEFAYPSRPSTQILQGLNLSAMQGQAIALVGSSGCGKSTCIQLLVRFYDAAKGFTAIDEKDVTSLRLDNLRSQIGIVSQEPSLFDRTIAENVAYGDTSREVSQAEIIEVSKQANIHNFVTSLPLVSSRNSLYRNKFNNQFFRAMKQD